MSEETMTPNVERILTLSTGHITERDCKILEQERSVNLSVYPIHYGPLVWIPYDDAGLCEDLVKGSLKVDDGLSAGFVKCFEMAYKLGCRYIRFDRDAGFTEGLDIHDW